MDSFTLYWIRIGLHIPARMLSNIPRRLNAVVRRLNLCTDFHEDAVAEIEDAVDSYRLWCERPGNDVLPECLSVTATGLENQATALEQKLSVLERYCTSEGH